VVLEDTVEGGLGAETHAVEQLQNILVSVFSWAWTSSPITGSNCMGSTIQFYLGPSCTGNQYQCCQFRQAIYDHLKSCNACSEKSRVVDGQ
jgi:hypothetical protein